MENDYPAAHSMDTVWFAVDRDGHVAIFDTGEAGAVPAGALCGEEADNVMEHLAHLPRVEARYDPSAYRHYGSDQVMNAHTGLRGSEHPILMFLSSFEPVEDEVSAGRAVQLPATEGVVVLFQTLPEALGRRLHDSGTCLGCDWHFQNPEMEELQPDLAARGLFTYTHLTDNWISGPYGRKRQPTTPIHVDQLPPRIRQALGAMRFESLCFAETPHIQPVEHTECVSWESAYMDVTGKHIRPMPGREDEYAEAYEDLADLTNEDGEPSIEPPPGYQP